MAELVVVGVDGSEHADRALRWALSYATGRDAVVRVVHAWAWEQIVGVPGARFPVETLEEAERKATETIRAALDRMDPGMRQSVEVERVIEFGPPARVLLDQAAGAGLLVVGSRGRGGFAELVLGSVSHQCVLHAPCPTVVVPSPDDRPGHARP